MKKTIFNILSAVILPYAYIRFVIVSTFREVDFEDMPRNYADMAADDILGNDCL